MKWKVKIELKWIEHRCIIKLISLALYLFSILIGQQNTNIWKKYLYLIHILHKYLLKQKII